MNLAHLANLARPEDLASHPRGIVGVALIAHLGGDFVLLRRLRQQPRFPRRPGKGFFHVDVLARLHASQGAGGVHVVGGPDDHGIDVLAGFIEHLAKVLVLLGLRPLGEPLLSAEPIHVRQRDHVLHSGFGIAQIAEGLAARADARDVQFLVGRFIAHGLQRGRASNGPGQERTIEEVTSRNAALRHADDPFPPTV
jgi:hypothetical protein